MSTEGLRERRKRQTRQEISHVATRLFIEHGFENVTIAQVAAAAGVAKMTVTNYFPRKEDLLLDMHEELVAGPAQVVAEREPGGSAPAALRRAYFEALARRDALIGFSGAEFVRVISGSPTLQARLREIHEQRERALADALAPELAEFTAKLLAAQATTAYRVLLEEIFRRTLDGADHEEIAAAIEPLAEQAFDALQRAFERGA
ncbi:TetR/AcrR family transcriptional regulator [Saccharopolyspora shandongensis]|uniref:TetR/AcrR family transcriptional regulator n=1 Tax=Saccharopolyspora shandongensis TaxID=418495 RepID=UPI0034138690